jgi:hypothetical protein
MKRCVPLTLFLLLLTGSAQAQAGEKNYALFPSGEGDPDAVTCRPPNARLNVPEVCKKNSIWAQYRRDGMDVAPDGIHDVPQRGNGGINCTAVAMPSGASGPFRIGMTCLDVTPDRTHAAPPRRNSGIICTAGMNCS